MASEFYPGDEAGEVYHLDAKVCRVPWQDGLSGQSGHLVETLPGTTLQLECCAG